MEQAATQLPEIQSSEKRIFLIQDQSEDGLILLLNKVFGGSTESKECGVFEGCEGGLEGGIVNVTCIPWKVSLITGILILFTLLTVVSNTVIVAVIIRTKNLRKPSGFFKLSLALAQLIYGATYIPSVIYNINKKIFYDGRDSSQLSLIRGPNVQKTLSINYIRSNLIDIPDLSTTDLNVIEMKIFAFIGYLTSIVTLLSLLMIAVDSFIAVRWPLSYRFGSILSKKGATRIVIGIWISSTVLSLLPVVITSAFQPVLFTPTFMYIFSYKELPSTEDENSVIKYIHILIYTIVVWGLPFVTTWIVTVLMAVQSYKMLNSFKTTTAVSNAAVATSDDKPDMDLIRTFTIILTTFTVTILPIVITLIVFIVLPPEVCATPNTTSALFFAFSFYTVGGFLNVIIYNFFHKEFREATRVLMYDVAQSMASVFPCINSLLPYEKQQQRRRTSSFITTTISRIRSVRKSRSTKNQPKSPTTTVTTDKPIAVVSMEMTVTSSSISDSNSNENK